ncbi:MAG: OmpA family protein [Parachlamydiales bacterium]|nr:OmpA family protein [Parachlamydiales bacterium]
MKKGLLLAIMAFAFASCHRGGNDTWESMKTAGRYMNRGIDSLFGKDYDSQLLTSEKEFSGPNEGDYIPLRDADLSSQFQTGDTSIAQAQGASGRYITPPARLQGIFKTIHFTTDDHVIRSREDLMVVSRIANFLKKNPKMNVTIEGHCDERASAAYNLALGTRRANHVRVLLIKQGIDFHRIYTISYGKERPAAMGHSGEDWHQNRRVEFKIAEKR